MKRKPETKIVIKISHTRSEFHDYLLSVDEALTDDIYKFLSMAPSVLIVPTDRFYIINRIMRDHLFNE